MYTGSRVYLKSSNSVTVIFLLLQDLLRYVVSVVCTSNSNVPETYSGVETSLTCCKSSGRTRRVKELKYVKLSFQFRRNMR